jgi:tetraacyldisaccharide 4'-kinase
VPHIQRADRVAAAREAVEKHACQVVILDDGFQHRRLARDLDLVLLDALEPFGYGYVLPRGLLREPVEGLRRADAVLLTRRDLVTAQRREEIRAQVRRLAPRALWLEGEHRPQKLLAAEGEPRAAAIRQSAAACPPPPRLPEDPAWLQGRSVAAFCGIGNPLAFRRTLEQTGCRVAAWRTFPDHHAYSAADLAALARWADAAPVEAVLCTHKDLVKLRRTALGTRPLAALIVRLEIVAGLAAWEAKLNELTPRER